MPSSLGGSHTSIKYQCTSRREPHIVHMCAKLSLFPHASLCHTVATSSRPLGWLNWASWQGGHRTEQPTETQRTVSKTDDLVSGIQGPPHLGEIIRPSEYLIPKPHCHPELWEHSLRRRWQKAAVDLSEFPRFDSSARETSTKSVF